MLALQDIAGQRRAQYAAVVFDDPVVERLLLGNSSRLPQGDLNLQSVIALATAAAAASSAQGSLDPAAFGQLAGQGTAVAFMLSKELSVLRKLQARFGGAEVQAINLMHNASAQHALPSLLSGEAEVSVILEWSLNSPESHMIIGCTIIILQINFQSTLLDYGIQQACSRQQGKALSSYPCRIHICTMESLLSTS